MKTLFNPQQLHRLETVAVRAAEDCSATFSRWLKSDIAIAMKSIERAPFHKVVADLQNPEETSVGLFMTLETGLAGSLLFLLGEKSAFGLVDFLLRKPQGTVTSLSSLSKSALKESANILACGYLNSFCKGMGLEGLHPSPPIILHDMAQAIMESVLLEQAALQESAIIFHIDFAHALGRVNCHFFFFPTLGSLKAAV